MSKLKAYTADDIQELDDKRLEESESGKIDCTRVYIKSEADEVIVAKVKELRHHKYKRCLDKAKWCKLWYETEKHEWHLKDVHHWFRLSLYDKWCKRWLELAEKFKEDL